MPDDANAVYSLPGSYLAVTGTTIQTSQHNPPFEDIATALTGRLARSGANAMTGPFKAADGTVGAPSVTFATALTTGFYKTAGGNIGVAVGGSEVVEFGAGGMVKGGKIVGELFDYSGQARPPLCVFPYGQTLSRTAYPALWALAQTEIANGNVFYNNGNGSTTFGVADLRGRVRAALDHLGDPGNNIPAGRLTSLTFSPNAVTIGAASSGVNQGEMITLTNSQMPVHLHPNTLNELPHSHGGSVFVSQSNSNLQAGGNAVPTIVNASGIAPATTGISISNANAGGGGAHGNVQPTIIVNVCLFAGA